MTKKEEEQVEEFKKLKNSYVASFVKGKNGKRALNIIKMRLKNRLKLNSLLSLNDYMYKMFNLTASIDSDKMGIILKNMITEMYKDTLGSAKDFTASLIEQSISKALVSISAGWYQVIKGSNQLAPMAWDAITKPTSIDLSIKRKDDNNFEVKSTVPSVFDKLNYIQFADDSNLLHSTANIKYVSTKDATVYNTIDADGSTNILVKSGQKIIFNNLAIVTNTDMAEDYFSKK